MTLKRLMGITNYTYLSSFGGEGWTPDGGNFTSMIYSGNTLFFFKSFATPETYSGSMTQSPTFKTYADLGVPLGNKVTGIRLISTDSSVSAGSTFSSELIQFYSFEANLGLYDVTSSFGFVDNSSGPVIEIDKLPSDYLQLTVQPFVQIDFDPFENYQDLQLTMNSIHIEITYERMSKNKMMFII